MLNKEIYLREEEQIQLKEIIRKGVHNARQSSFNAGPYRKSRSCEI